MRSTRCLFCRLAPAATPKSQQPTSRAFSTTPTTLAKGKPAYPNVRAVDLGLVQQRVDTAVRAFKPYTPREKQLLALKYTPEQVRAIEAAEASIDPKDVVSQGKICRDTFALNYIDDLSKIQPLVDKPVRAPTADIDPAIRMRTDDEVLDRFAAWTEEFNRKRKEYEIRIESMDGEQIEQELLTKSIEAGIYPGDKLSPDERRARLRKYAEHFEGPDANAEWNAFIGNAANFFFSPKGTLDSQQDSLAPAIPKIKKLGVRFESEDDDPHLLRLMQQTGLEKDEIKKIRVKKLVSHRVVNQTRLGKIQSHYYLTIAGNENGMLGVGEGKSAEVEDASRQAMYAAIRNMKPIPRYENRTIYGEVEAKVGASVVEISSRPPGKDRLFLLKPLRLTRYTHP
jgi:small subunit ribosomal protein S5